MKRRPELARLAALERKALLEELAAAVAAGELRLGEAARLLRSAFLGMDRVTFARRVKLAPSALARLEDDPNANPTLDTLTRVFAPFGGKLGLLFPGLVEPPPLDDERRRRREALRTALAKSRRQPRR